MGPDGIIDAHISYQVAAFSSILEWFIDTDLHLPRIRFTEYCLPRDYIPYSTVTCISPWLLV